MPDSPTPAGAAPGDEAREISSREDAKQRTCRAVIAFVRGGASDWGFLEGEVYAALDAVLAAAPRADPLGAASETALRLALKAVEDEPEYPGEPPAELLAMLADTTVAAEALRATVRLTKTGIASRLRAAARAPGRAG